MTINRAPLPPPVRAIQSGPFGVFGSKSAGPFEQLPLSNQAYTPGADFLRLDFDMPHQVGDTIWVPTPIGGAGSATTVRVPFGRSCAIMIDAAGATNGAQVQFNSNSRATHLSGRAISTVLYAFSSRDTVDPALTTPGTPTNAAGLRAYFVGVAARNAVTPILTGLGDLENLNNYVGFHFKLGESTLNLPRLVARGSGPGVTVFTRNSVNAVIQAAGSSGSATVAVRSIGPSYVDFWELAGNTTPNGATAWEFLTQGSGNITNGNFNATLVPTVAFVLDGAAEDGIQVLRFVTASAQP